MIDQSRKEQAATRPALKLGECPRGQACAVGVIMKERLLLCVRSVGPIGQGIFKLGSFQVRPEYSAPTLRQLHVLHTTFRSTVRPATMGLVALDAPSGQEKVSRDMPLRLPGG